MSEELKTNYDSEEFVDDVEETSTEPQKENYYKPESNKDRAQDAFKARTEKREPKVSLDEVKQMLEENTQTILANINAKREDELLSSLSGTTEEKEAIKFHLDNSIKRSSDPVEDIKRAKILANGHKLDSIDKEVSAIRTSRLTGAGSSPTSYVPDNSDTIQLTDRERQMAQRFGLDTNTLKPISK